MFSRVIRCDGYTRLVHRLTKYWYTVYAWELSVYLGAGSGTRYLWRWANTRQLGILSPVIPQNYHHIKFIPSKSPIQSVYNTPKETGLAPQISNLVSEPPPSKKCAKREREMREEILKVKNKVKGNV